MDLWAFCKAVMHTHLINLHHPKASGDALMAAELLYPYSCDVQLYLLLQTYPNPEIQVWVLQVLIELL